MLSGDPSIEVVIPKAAALQKTHSTGGWSALQGTKATASGNEVGSREGRTSMDHLAFEKSENAM